MKKEKTNKRIISIVLLLMISIAALSSCGSPKTEEADQTETEAVTEQTDNAADTTEDSESDTEIRVAKDGAEMQTENPTMPTRVPMEGGTKINMHFGDTVIPGVLNDSETAKALIAKLPYTQTVSRYSHDFCGVT